jgi:hypothetical protein
MTRKFVKGEIVKIGESDNKKIIGKFGKIIYIASINSHPFPFMNKKRVYYLIRRYERPENGNAQKKMFSKLFYRNQISHVSKKIQEEFLAKELAEKL